MADYKVPIITGTSLAVGDVLRWDGGDWVNYPDSNFGGASTFVGLTDTPANYAGSAGKFPVVNGGENALDFTTLTGTGGFSSRCNVYLSADQSIPSITSTKIQFNTENYDADGEYDNAVNYRFTAIAAGYYHVSLRGFIELLGDDKYGSISIRKNGTIICEEGFHAGAGAWGFGSALSVDVYLNGSTDYIEGFAYHEHGSNRNIAGGEATTGMTIHRFAGTDGVDVKVGIDSGATAGYLGAANNDGVLRTGAGLSYADGGDFITLTADVGIADDKIMQVDDADAADDDYAKFTANGLEGRSYAEVLGDLSGQAGGAFSFNSQNLTGIGAIGCGAITGTSTALFEGASITVGKANTTTGTLILHDSNSANTITLTVPDISAGSLSFTLPPTDGDNTEVLQTNGSGVLSWVANAGGGSGYLGYIKLSDVKAQNTDGGTFTKDVWRTRVLNTEDSDTNTDCSLAANQITLDAGTYECSISCPSYEVQYNQTRLYNTTGAAVVLLGTSEFSASGAQSRSFIVGRFTIAGSQALEVQHICSTTVANLGFGVATDRTSEVYTVAEFRRVS